MYILKLKTKQIIITLLTFISLFVFLCFAKTNTKTVDVPAIMYHHVSDNSDKLSKYVISPYEFQSDLNYLKNKGYKTVFIKDLIDFVNGKGTLPDKPILITFDDGYLSNYEYIFPEIKKNDVKITLSVIGKYIDMYTENKDRNINYAHITWNDLKEMYNSNLVEIANHTYNCHNLAVRKGIRKSDNETDETYKSFLAKDLALNDLKIKEIIGERPYVFTYPFGITDKTGDKIIENAGYKATLSCSEGINKIERYNPKCLYMIKRYNRPSGISTYDFFNKKGI